MENQSTNPPTHPSVVRTAVRSATAGPGVTWPEAAFPPPGGIDDDVSGRVLPCGGARPNMASRAHMGTYTVAGSCTYTVVATGWGWGWGWDGWGWARLLGPPSVYGQVV